MLRMLHATLGPMPGYLGASLAILGKHFMLDVQSMLASGDPEVHRARFLEDVKNLCDEQQVPSWTFSMDTVIQYFHMLVHDRDGCFKVVENFGMRGFTFVFEMAMNMPFVWALICVYLVHHFMTVGGQLLVDERVRRLSNVVVGPFGQVIVVFKLIHCAMLCTDFWKSTPVERETDCNRTTWFLVVFVACWAVNKSDSSWFRFGIQLAWAAVTHFVTFSLGVLVFSPMVEAGINATFKGVGGLNMTAIAEVHDMTNISCVADKLKMRNTTIFMSSSMTLTLFTNKTNFGFWVQKDLK